MLIAAILTERRNSWELVFVFIACCCHKVQISSPHAATLNPPAPGGKKDPKPGHWSTTLIERHNLIGCCPAGIV